MSRIAWLAGMCVLVSLVAAAETTSFPGGTLDVLWADDTTLSLRVALDAPAPQTGSAVLMWVLTVQASRFADGIHSWQLRLSPTYASIVVVPNDFLATQRFTLEQLRVEVVASDPGRSLSLRIPRSGPIPELVAPGDAVEVHALWLQRQPIVTASLPDVEFEGAGGGGSEGGGGRLIPPQQVYTLGATIRHEFVLVDPATGQPVLEGAALVGFVRIGGDGAGELVRYLYCEANPETGVVTYEIDTTGLAAGTYEIIVHATSGATERRRVELVAASPSGPP
jgi:hypothetical protein